MTNKQRYIDWCSTQQNLPLFVQPYWLDAVAPNWNCLFLEQNNKQIFFPYLLQKKYLFTFIRNILGVPYSGVIGDTKCLCHNTEQHFYKQLNIFLKKTNWVEIDFLENSFAKYFAEKHQYNLITMRTNCIDLAPKIQEIESKFSQNIKRQIKSAKQNLQIIETQNAIELYNLLEKSAQKNKIKNAYNLQLIEQINICCNNHQCGKILLVTDKDKNIHAGMLLVWDSTTGYNLLNGLNYEFKNSGAMSLLFHYAISYCQSINLSTFDFEGSMIGGVDAFYKKFGGNEKLYYRVQLQSTTIKLLSKLKKHL